MNSKLSRRALLQGVSAAAGLAVGSRIAGRRWLGTAAADGGEKSALVVIYCRGGYNPIFGSADSFLAKGSFGVNSGNIVDLGSGLVVDAPTFGTLPAIAKQHMASIGIGDLSTDHVFQAQRNWTDGTRAYPLMLANAMGGEASIKCAAIGGRPTLYDMADPPAENGVSYQEIYDMQSTIRALGGGTVDPNVPDRGIAAKALAASEAMSSARLATNGKSLKDVKEGYDTVIDTLKKPVKPFTFGDIASAYGRSTTDFDVHGDDTGDDFKSKLVAAELMVLAGANVITMETGFIWDSHGNSDASSDRDSMSQVIMPGLNVFLDRMLNLPDANVVVTLMGDFGRSLPNCDHQPNMTATVIGKYVKQGTTGKVDEDAGLPRSTPSTSAYWAYLAAALKCANQPFGVNPHPLVL